MKRIWGALISLACLLILLGVIDASAETNAVVDYDKLVAEYEPLPCGTFFLQETTPFNPISIGPQELIEQINQNKNFDETTALFHDLGLPLYGKTRFHRFWEGLGAETALFPFSRMKSTPETRYYKKST